MREQNFQIGIAGIVNLGRVIFCCPGPPGFSRFIIDKTMKTMVLFVCLFDPGIALSKMVIEKVYHEGDYLYAIVSYVNDTEETFKSVTIECSAMNEDNETINTNKRSFFSYQHGPLEPGFTGTAKIPIKTYEARPDSASCVVTPVKSAGE